MPNNLPEVNTWHHRQKRDEKGRFYGVRLPGAKKGRKLLSRGVLGSRITRAPVLRQSLCHVLRDMRLKSKLSVDQVAALANIGKKTLVRYESGEAFNSDDGPGIIAIERVVRAMGGRLVIEYDADRSFASGKSSSLMFIKAAPSGRKLRSPDERADT